MHRHPHLEAFVNGSVCGSCNNGWMSQLETRVEPIFLKLTTGTDIRDLKPDEIDTLARWTGKTAIVLGYVLPNPVIVPSFIRKSFLPTHTALPHMRLFYAFIDRSDLTLEGGYLQLKYAAEVPVIGETGGSGFRFTLCVHNHCLTVDFPPILEAVQYDLSQSCSAQLWPIYVPAGATLSIPGPIPIGDALRIICGQIRVAFDIGQMHV